MHSGLNYITHIGVRVLSWAWRWSRLVESVASWVTAWHVRGFKPVLKHLRKSISCVHNVYDILFSSQFHLVKIHVKRKLKVKRALDYITTLFACEIIICILLDRNKVILNLIIHKYLNFEINLNSFVYIEYKPQSVIHYNKLRKPNEFIYIKYKVRQKTLTVTKLIV